MTTAETGSFAETIAPEELRDAATRLLSAKVDRRSGWAETPPDARALQTDMAELGWPLLTIPAQRGGLGQSFAALAPIYEELGRALAPATLAGTMAAVDVLAGETGTAIDALFDRIGTGAAHVVVMFGSVVGDDHTIRLMPGAISATDLLFIPDDPAQPMLLADLTPSNATAVEVWDRTRPFGDITVSLANAVALAGAVAPARAIAHAHLDLALAWDSVGAAQQSLAEAVSYMIMRKQFDRPIGSFQALKHRAADHKVAIDVALALTQHATAAFAERSDSWAHLAGAARLLAVDAFRAMAEDSVQLHGGIGFTWAHDCHLFLKRAIMNEVLGETQDQVRDRIAPAIIGKALQRR